MVLLTKHIVKQNVNSEVDVMKVVEKYIEITKVADNRRIRKFLSIMEKGTEFE